MEPFINLLFNISLQLRLFSNNSLLLWPLCPERQQCRRQLAHIYVAPDADICTGPIPG